MKHYFSFTIFIKDLDVIMQVGMAEWSKSLPPDWGVVGSILGDDSL